MKRRIENPLAEPEAPLRPTNRTGRFILPLLQILTLSFVCSAQSRMPEQPDNAPPPLIILSADERSLLKEKAEDVKGRTKLALELMERRLDVAERLTDQGQFPAMYAELGGFHALMNDSLDYLRRRNTGKNGKVLDGYKRLEIGLRGFAVRVQTIRRDLPVCYDEYVKKLVKIVRDARTKATTPLFGDSVLPVRGNEKK